MDKRKHLKGQLRDAFFAHMLFPMRLHREVLLKYYCISLQDIIIPDRTLCCNSFSEYLF
jgi:hypothetical protein